MENNEKNLRGFSWIPEQGGESRSGTKYEHIKCLFKFPKLMKEINPWIQELINT